MGDEISSYIINRGISKSGQHFIDAYFIMWMHRCDPIMRLNVYICRYIHTTALCCWPNTTEMTHLNSKNTVFIYTYIGFIVKLYLEQEADVSYIGLCVFNNANIDDLWLLFKRWWMYDLLINVRVLSMWTYKMPVQYIFWHFMVEDQSLHCTCNTMHATKCR